MVTDGDSDSALPFVVVIAGGVDFTHVGIIVVIVLFTIVLFTIVVIMMVAVIALRFCC